jgi:hypothetical protein
MEEYRCRKCNSSDISDNDDRIKDKICDDCNYEANEFDFIEYAEDWEEWDWDEDLND